MNICKNEIDDNIIIIITMIIMLNVNNHSDINNYSNKDKWS